MKCSYCGFTYDDEAACPICGTPAPQPQGMPMYAYPEPEAPAPAPYEAPVPPFAGSPVSEYHAPAAPAPRQEPRRKERPPLHKGMRIAFLCVLSVIAAALVYIAVVHSIYVFRGRPDGKHTAAASTTVPETSAPDTTAPDATVPDTTVPLTTEPPATAAPTTAPATAPATQPKTGSGVLSVGESRSFPGGVLTLQSVKLSDKAARKAAFTVTLTNNTKKEQRYSFPDIAVGDSAFDAENFLYCETATGDRTAYTLKPGETLSAVYYYRIPQDNQKLNCTLHTSCTGAEPPSVTAEYRLETKDIK